MIHLRYILIDNRLLKLNKVRYVEMMWVNMNMAMTKFKMAQYIINELTIVFAKAESGRRIEEMADETKVTRPDCSYGRVKESLVTF